MKAFLTVTLALTLCGCLHPEQNLPQRQLSADESQELEMRKIYLGKTREELQAVFRAEVTGQEQNDTWEIWDRLRLGPNSFVGVTQIKFRDNIAVEVNRRVENVGCILVEQAEAK
jgi:hypothetical protein